MLQFLHLNFFQVILYLCWISGRVLSQELSNYVDRVPVEGTTGSQSYFYYQQPQYARDCFEARSQCSVSNQSGVHLIKPDGYPQPFEVYCDNTVDSGGWTVIHRIQDGSVLFNRNSTDYKTGFGFLSQEFWIGNEKLSLLTNQNTYELRIDVTTLDGPSFYVTYNRFRIGDEYGQYRLASVGEYTGRKDHIDRFLCPPNSEGGEAYISADCTRRCFCSNGQFSCDDTYRCSPNAVCEERNNRLQCYCSEGHGGDGVNCTSISDCQDVYDVVSTESGVYKIKPTTWQGDPFDVYCNMTDGGGWTVFQRRVNGSQDFHLYWSDYKEGFGNPNHELWLGNDKLHSLTMQKSYQLRIDVINSLGDPNYASYSSFRVGDDISKYTLTVAGFNGGNAGNTVTYHNGRAFTTRDRDNDAWSGGNCATDRNSDALHSCSAYCNYNGGWWYYNCATASLNSPYGHFCLRWLNLPGNTCNIRYTEMKVRPN